MRTSVSNLKLQMSQGWNARYKFFFSSFPIVYFIDICLKLHKITLSSNCEKILHTGNVTTYQQTLYTDGYFPKSRKFLFVERKLKETF